MSHKECRSGRRSEPLFIIVQVRPCAIEVFLHLTRSQDQNVATWANTILRLFGGLGGCDRLVRAVAIADAMLATH